MKEAGCRLLIVGYESGDAQILRTSRRAQPSSARWTFSATATSWDWLCMATSSSACPARPRSRSATPSSLPSSSTARPSRFPCARLPGTELYDFAKEKGYITNLAMNDDEGHQLAHIEYPGLPAEYVLEMVSKFYDEYFFRPKAALRVVWKAIVNRDVPGCGPRRAAS